MSKECEKYTNLILEKVESACEVDVFLLEHIHKCSFCSKFYNEMEQMQNELEKLGFLVNGVLPKINVCENIKDELKKIKNGEIIVRDMVEREDNVPEIAEWYSYIEDDLDEIARYRCEMKLEKSSNFRQEIEQLSSIHHLLSEIGETWKAPSLKEDLTPCIVDKIQRYKLSLMSDKTEDDVEVIEEELYKLSCVVSDLIKRVDLTPKVTKEIKGVLQSPIKKGNSKNIVSIFSVKKESKRHSLMRYVIPIAVAVVFLLTLLGVYVNNYFVRIDINGVYTAKNNTLNIGEKTKDDSYKTTLPFYMRDNVQTSEEGEQRNEKKIKSRNNSYAEGLLSNWSKQLKDNALANAGKLLRMGIWATLTPEEARDLLEKSGLSPEAVLGVVQFLPPEEARVVLQAAIDSNPNDAYLRYAMVQTLKKMDNIPDEELYAHLTTWSQLDTGNVLPHFMEAELYFRNGENEKAVSCITDAGNSSNYNSYAMVTTKAYMEALLAKGVDFETAKLLASASMGLHEVQTLEEIAQTLLEYGKTYEESGDYSTALLIYEALRNLGMKVDMSSALIQEKLAGLKYTQEAVNAMFRLMSTTNSFSDTQSLIDFTQTLSEMMTNYNLAMDSFYKLFDSNDPAEIIQMLNLYLTSGNAFLNSVPAPRK